MLSANKTSASGSEFNFFSNSIENIHHCANNRAIFFRSKINKHNTFNGIFASYSTIYTITCSKNIRALTHHIQNVIIDPDYHENNYFIKK